VHAAEAGARIWCDRRCYFQPVIDKRFLDDLSTRIDEALRASPAQDIEKNLKALLAAWFDRMDLVLREDFDVQKKLLERAQAKLAELETRIAELEARKPTR
jgi:BMFP domain-containing protein YqiC